MKMRMVVAVALTGCVTPNPKNCADGTCSDPALPYCDVDGTLSGTAGTCIAVSCTPDEFISCRGDTAISCDQSGANYDNTLCPRGCNAAASGCVECATNADCSDPMKPICNTDTLTCRGCNADSECTSDVCEAGTCLTEDSIVYVSPSGTGDVCSHAKPCDFNTGLAVAHDAPVQPTVRMLEGVYVSNVSAEPAVATANPLEIVATGATVAGSFGLVGHFDIRGLSVAGTVECDQSLAMTFDATLDLHDGDTAAGSHLDLEQGCSGHFRGMEIAGSVFLSGGSTTPSTVVGDQLRFTSQSDLDLRGFALDLTITNSVFDDTTLQLNSFDMSPPSSWRFAFDTFAFSSANGQLVCPTAIATRTMTLEDSIINAASPPVGAPSAVVGAGCTLSHDVLFPQQSSPPTNIASDPLFVDRAAGDFHLSPTSPAIDAASPSAGLGTDHDFDGTSRPQGAGSDIGAFEAKP